MTSPEEVKKLRKDGWIVTDPSCNQLRKEIIKDEVYIFREDRISNPETKETFLFEEEIDYKDYDWFDLVEACTPFGYSHKQIDKWITEGEEIELMLECLFEMSY